VEAFFSLYSSMTYSFIVNFLLEEIEDSPTPLSSS